MTALIGKVKGEEWLFSGVDGVDLVDGVDGVARVLLTYGRL